MSLVQYTISNNSSVGKTFTYNSASAPYNIFVPGFTSSIFLGDNAPPPTLLITGSMVSEDTFVSDAYIPPSGSAWLWNNGDKVQYIKISNTPLTGSNIGTIINNAEWIEFSMVGAKDKNGNFLYPASPNSASVERYTMYSAINNGSYSSINVNPLSLETTNAVTADVTNTETGFSYIDQQFIINQDCNPLLNNATEPRVNEWLQDVDYSVNAITPINFAQILSGSATKSTIPQSNYTQLGFVNSRYVGSSTTRDNINEYDPTGSSDPINKFLYFDDPSSFFVNRGKGPTFGKIPNVELNNAYIAYFNKIIDPYPLLNNKVAYYVKYLIDEGGNILDPNISDINFSIFKDTFQLKDYDNSPTRVNTAISTIEQGKELVKLTDGLHPVHTIGAYPVPILYTQTSSIGYASEIPLSGSQFFTAFGVGGGNFVRLGIDIYATQSVTPNTNRLTPTNLSSNAITWASSDITPLKTNINPSRTPPTFYPTSSALPSQAFLFPLDNTGSASPPLTPGGTLSDNYRVIGNFTFTTSTIPGKYTGGDDEDLGNSIKFFIEKPTSKRNDFGTLFEGNPFLGTLVNYPNRWFLFKLSPHIKPPLLNDVSGSYINNNEGFKINKVKLVITTNPGENDQFIYPALEIEKDTNAYGIQWRETSEGLRLSPNSYYIEELIIQNLLRGNVNNEADRREAIPLIAGGWSTSGGSTFGYGGIPVKYDWIIEFEFNNIRQKTGLFLTYEGTMSTDQDDQGKNTRPRDIFLFFGADGIRPKPSELQWRRTFTPSFTGVNTKPVVEYLVTSPYSEETVTNSAPAPFWRRYPTDPTNPTSSLTPDQLYLSSSILNQTYGRSFSQAKIPYTGSTSTDFPLTVEPSFIEFDPIVDPWELEPGDEIRFQNDEDLTYKIINITIPPGRNPRSEDIEQKIRITVSPPFNSQSENAIPYNFDFFVIRRYKNNKNFIILDQQMPYGVISTGKGQIAFSGEDGFVGVEPVNPSSSPGLLLPQFRVGKFNTNPDLILKDLIEKDTIT
jgi:hypothetical protein